MSRVPIFGYQQPLDPEQLKELRDLMRSQPNIGLEDGGNGKLVLTLGSGDKITFTVEGWADDAWVGWDIEYA